MNSTTGSNNILSFNELLGIYANMQSFITNNPNNSRITTMYRDEIDKQKDVNNRTILFRYYFNCIDNILYCPNPVITLTNQSQNCTIM